MEIHSGKLCRLYEDWEHRCNGRPYPARSKFDPVDLGYIIGDIFLVDVLRQAGGLNFRFRLYGTHLVDRFGADLTHKLVDEVPNAERRQFARVHLTEAVTTAKPVAHLRNHWFKDQNAPNDCEVLVLPLSDDGATINMLLCGFGWDV